MSNPKRGEPPLGKEQYAYCKEEGHWKKDCPRLKHKKNNKKTGASHIVREPLTKAACLGQARCMITTCLTTGGSDKEHGAAPKN